MRRDPYPIRRCQNPACRRPFNSRPRREAGGIVWTKHCSWSCAQVTVRSQTRGKPLTAAVEARIAQAKARREQFLAAEFGPLSDREQALLTWAQRYFEQRGYQRAYRERRRIA